MEKISKESYLVMPWKNGQGTTTQLIIHPPNSSLDDFEWRISCANVSSSGPFSTFQKHDRILYLLEGADHIDLTHEGEEVRHRILRQEIGGGYRFKGSIPTYSDIPSPILDLNVMYLKDRFEVSSNLFQSSTEVPLVPGTNIIYCIEGKISVQQPQIGFASLTKGQLIKLELKSQPTESLRCDFEEASSVVLISIRTLST
eukprot:TRINITY_DN17392_c0_g1_i1.p1 TRINITY_DN17392_c0_g1~~TRINITY_DN17392_c0_g1_i1.p1  ORF type:complete len:200 (+),score=24.84 TRINITY_DN17392_c0_g1_i1:11-610(+)